MTYGFTSNGPITFFLPESRESAGEGANVPALDNTPATGDLRLADIYARTALVERHGIFRGPHVAMGVEEAKAIRAGIYAGWEFRRRVLAAIDMLDACDTAIPSERRAALARVREVLEGESNG